VEFLEAFDPSEHAVVEMDQDGRDVQTDQCFKLARGHAQAAVSEEPDQPRIGAGQVGPDHSGYGVTQSPVCPGNQKAGPVSPEFQVTGGVGRRCAGIGDDDRNVGHPLVQRSDDPLGLQRGFLGNKLALGGLPETGPFPIQHVDSGRIGSTGRLASDQNGQVFHDQSGIPGDAQRVFEVVAQRFRIEVDLDDLAVRLPGGHRPVDGGYGAHLAADVQ